MLWFLMGFFLNGAALRADLTVTAKGAKPYLVQGVALQRYDAVSYLDDLKAEQGQEKFSALYENARYLFVSQKHLAAFQANPKKYIPAFGGWCAYAMARGELVEVDPKNFKIVDHKLLLFYNGLWGGNTLTKWNKDEAALKAKADIWWKKLN